MGWILRPSNDVATTLENCWSFNNGYLKNGNISSGNGNGFKMGGGDTSNINHLKHNMVLKRCLAFDNRVKGFDQNNNTGSMTLYNCTAYRNGSNYVISGVLDSGKVLIVINCVSVGNFGSLGGFAIQQTNSWLSPFSVSNADFVTVDTAGARGPRKADGSLPDITFMHLAAGSRLINAGTIVGLPYSGSAPDLGAFEYETTTSVNKEQVVSSSTSYTLLQSFPNPFNPTTTISYQLSKRSSVTLKVYDIFGRELAMLVEESKAPGNHLIEFNGGGLSSGIYFACLKTGGSIKTIKLTLLK